VSSLGSLIVTVQQQGQQNESPDQKFKLKMVRVTHFVIPNLLHSFYVTYLWFPCIDVHFCLYGWILHLV